MSAAAHVSQSSSSLDRTLFPLESPSDQKPGHLQGSNSFAPSQHYPRSASRTRVDSGTSTDSLYGKRKIRFRPVWNCVSCKELDIDQYRFLLLATVLFNILMTVAEIARTVYIFNHRNDFSSISDSSKNNVSDEIAIILSVAATVLTFVNCGCLLYLIYRPLPRLAVFASCITLILEVVYIVQTALYFGDFTEEIGYTIITILFLIIQLGTAWLLYRFWEFAFFNYDEGGAGLRNLVEDYQSGSLFSSGQDLEQALNPTHESSHNSSGVEDSFSRHVQQAVAAGSMDSARGRAAMQRAMADKPLGEMSIARADSASNSRHSQRSLKAAS